jgi:2-methylisocitrate lyase-like PEP mutase family enzyme
MGVAQDQSSTFFSSENGEVSRTHIVVAVWDVLSAAAAKAAGATHLFLSGAALNNVHGYPDRGVLDIADVCRTVSEITNAVGLPIMIDAETGFGSLPRMVHLILELRRAGATAIMIEDQDVTGQSKQVKAPAIGDPEEMCEKIRVVRSTVGQDLGILARTDYVPGMDFDESLSRLKKYVDAGANWAMPVFVPSLEALRASAIAFPDKLFLLLAPGPWPNGPLLPHHEHLAELKPRGMLVTGQYRNAFVALKDSYRLSLKGEWRDLHAQRPAPAYLDESLGLTRPGMSL